MCVGGLRHGMKPNAKLARRAPRTQQKDTKIAPLANTHNGNYEELRSEDKTQKQDSC